MNQTVEKLRARIFVDKYTLYTEKSGYLRNHIKRPRESR
jgi:hypothetical protein